MDHTTNYQLSQWAKSDPVQRADFNADNAKIDAALKAQADTLASVRSQLPKKGNCTVETFTYTGTGRSGNDNPTIVQFRKKPAAFFIYGSNSVLFGSASAPYVHLISPGAGGSTCEWDAPQTWNGSQLRFEYSSANATQQLNLSGRVYYVIAFYPAP